MSSLAEKEHISEENIIVSNALSTLRIEENKLKAAIHASSMPSGLQQAVILQIDAFLEETKYRLEVSLNDAERLKLIRDGKQQLIGLRKVAALQGTHDFQAFYQRLRPNNEPFNLKELNECLKDAPSYAISKANVFLFNPLHLVCRHNRSSLIRAIMVTQAAFYQPAEAERVLTERSGAPFYATPLILAIESGAISAITKLINYSQLEEFDAYGAKAQLNTPDGSALANTPLIKAVCLEATYADNYAAPKLYDYTVTGALIKAGALLNQTNARGRSALHYAMLYQDFVLANYLIEKGANLFLKDKYGATPFHLSLLSDQEVEEELSGQALKLFRENKRIKTIERHQTLFLNAVSGVSLEQKESMQLLLKLSQLLDELYVSHCYAGGRFKKDEFFKLRKKLFACFSDFSRPARHATIQSLFTGFIRQVLSEVDYKMAMDRLYELLESANDKTLLREKKKRSTQEKLELLRKAYRNEAIIACNLDRWLKLFPKNVSRKERLQKLFLPLREDRDASWLQQVFFHPQNQFQLERQMSFCEALCEALREEALIAEWINVESFLELLKSLKPLNQKIEELSGDNSNLAKKKLAALKDFYGVGLELSFNLFKGQHFAVSPSKESCISFALELASRHENFLLAKGPMLAVRRNKLFDGVNALLSFIFSLIRRLFGRKKAKEKQPVGSSQALNESVKKLTETSENLKRWASHLQEENEDCSSNDKTSVEHANLFKRWQANKQIDNKPPLLSFSTLFKDTDSQEAPDVKACLKERRRSF